MARLPLAALCALTFSLLLSTAVQAAPTGKVTGKEARPGVWDYAAVVNWDLCPEICDWRINVVDINDPSGCSLDGVLKPGMADINSLSAVSAGMLANTAPYTNNGTKLDGYAGFSRLLPATSTQRHVLCLAAVGLTRPDPPPALEDAEAYHVWAQRQQSCVSPSTYYFSFDNRATNIDTRYRCLRFFPLGHVSFTVGGYTEPPYDPLGLFKPKSKGAGGTAQPAKLTRAEAVKALRRKKLKGTISCKKVSVSKQRCKVTAKKRKRTYMVTESAAGVRVKRA